MSSLFANRRKKARKVGQEDDEDTSDNVDQGPEPVVRKPTNTKPKLKSKLRMSFDPGETSMIDDGIEPSGVITPRKPRPPKKIIGKSSLQRTWTPSGSSENLPLRAGQDVDRPSYSQDYLKELRDSTPSTPKQTGSLNTSEDEGERELDIAAKFGEVVSVSNQLGQSAIPSEAEIREKKERRARLAKEQDFISLDTDESGELSLLPRKEQPETRLVRDDEDFAEGFDEFVEDGKISLGKKAEKEQRRRQRAEMKELINEAEESSDEDDSDAERRAAYEDAQTRAGMDGLGHEKSQRHPSRPKTPPKITSLPRLASNLEGLRLSLRIKEQAKLQLVRRMEELRKEKADIAVRETEIQKLLKEAGENYSRLRTEAGLDPATENGLPGDTVPTDDRGLESLGSNAGTPRLITENG
ncbi:hypothetical protein FQN54_003373 [Arachnomyces sp. PD_36]|nr:hypothetical protein FQN54_003373 [Arachnomyces sp. PD_36]